MDFSLSAGAEYPVEYRKVVLFAFAKVQSVQRVLALAACFPGKMLLFFTSLLCHPRTVPFGVPYSSLQCMGAEIQRYRLEVISGAGRFLSHGRRGHVKALTTYACRYVDTLYSPPPCKTGNRLLFQQSLTKLPPCTYGWADVLHTFSET